MRPQRDTTTPVIVELEISTLAAGGDGVARDAGRVTFVPLTVPGDRVRARMVETKPSFARAELVEVIAPGAARVVPGCPEVARGCGGCQWQQVARPAQLAAKQAIVANALRKLHGMTVHPIAAPAPPLGWRRRARFHVEAGKVGLYQRGSNRVLPLAHCPQLQPALDAAFAVVAAASPPDGELTMLLAHDDRIVIGVEQMWPAAGQLIGRAGIVGAVSGQAVWGDWMIEIEPGLGTGPNDFAQASAVGNAALIAQIRAAVGSPRPRATPPRTIQDVVEPKRARRSSYAQLISQIRVEPARAPYTGEHPEQTLIELYAGNGNLTRGFVADGWEVLASDVAEPRSIPNGVRFEIGSAPDVLARLTGPVEVVVLDPPRTGAADAIDGIVGLAPSTILYVSCDPATLARDAGRLVGAGYRPTDVWPLDLMPQTSHVEIVMRLLRSR